MGRVKPTVLVGTARVPGSDAEMRCLEHDGDYRIFVGGTELMSTRLFGSEEALAELALERRGDKRTARVLIGGLGMGFTLARTLALVGDDAVVDVVELVPEVVTWNRELFGHCAGHPLDDPRTRLTVADVGATLRAAAEPWDVVLLDVDNGPVGLSRASNSALYDYDGLAVVRRALRRGGVLGLWSSAEDPGFLRRLRRSGFTASRKRVRARRDKGPWRTIWLATAVGAGAS